MSAVPIDLLHDGFNGFRDVPSSRLIGAVQVGLAGMRDGTRELPLVGAEHLRLMPENAAGPKRKKGLFVVRGRTDRLR